MAKPSRAASGLAPHTSYSLSASPPNVPPVPTPPAAAPSWPDHFLSLPPIQDWIASSVAPRRSRPSRVELAQVYEAKTRAVTARFTVHHSGSSEDVVFKATLEPLFFYAPHVDRLLMRVAPCHVPELIAAQVVDIPTFGEGLPATAIAPEAALRRRGRLYSLYHPFVGPRLRQLFNAARDGDVAALQTTTEAAVTAARVFAAMQVAVAALPDEAKAGIPRVPVASLPALFDDLLERIERDYLARWVAGEGEYPPELPEPRAAFAHLRSMRAAVASWTAELASGPWPETIDHVDVGPHNAALEPDGRIVFFDWEESVLSCPFFSIVQWIWRANSASDAVRDAYLDALPWGTRPQRERALVLANRLHLIKDALTLEAIRESEGFPDGVQRLPGELRTMLKAWSTVE